VVEGEAGDRPEQPQALPSCVFHGKAATDSR